MAEAAAEATHREFIRIAFAAVKEAVGEEQATLMANDLAGRMQEVAA